MEAAAEAGRQAADAITGGNVTLKKRKFEMVKKLDDFLYSVQGPSMVDITILAIMIVIIIIIHRSLLRS
jgi:hypothetical protein